MAGTNGGDPAAYTRIRDAATREYGARGAAVTLDEIAAAAGVSLQALRRHFASETELREAINERVVTIAGRVFGDVDPATADVDDFDGLGRRTTILIRDHPDEVRYVARAAIDGDPDGLALFDAFMAIALASFEGLADNGVTDPDLDLEWAALHVVTFNLGVVLFQRAIEHHLPVPISEEEGMERWHTADNELFRHGYLRRGLRDRPVGRVS